MEDITLIHGDCLEEMKKIEDKSINLIITDLPYGTTACQWDKVLPIGKLWEQWNRIIKPNGVVVLFASGSFMPKVLLSNLDNYKYRWVWVKNKVYGFIHARNKPLVKSEDILVFSNAPMGHKALLKERRMVYNPQGLVQCSKILKGRRKQDKNQVLEDRPSNKDVYEQKFTNFPSDVLYFDSETKNRIHPSQKPVDLLSYLIKTYTEEGDVVLDCCCGSGTALIACIDTNRKGIGIEIDEDFYNKSKERIENHERI